MSGTVDEVVVQRVVRNIKTAMDMNRTPGARATKDSTTQPNPKKLIGRELVREEVFVCSITQVHLYGRRTF